MFLAQFQGSINHLVAKFARSYLSSFFSFRLFSSGRMGSSNSKSNKSYITEPSPTSTLIVGKTSVIRIRSNGGFWQSQVAFDPNAEQAFDVNNLRFINHDCLINEMASLIDTSENILSIAVYKCPLEEWQLFQLLDCHQFVVLETANWWYSIEKNSEFIYIQRTSKANSIEFVRCKIKNQRRNADILKISCANGRGSMGDLITFLCNNCELNKIYDSASSNCHEFAKTVFDKFNASGKSHEIILGCSPTVTINSPWY